MPHVVKKSVEATKWFPQEHIQRVAVEQMCQGRIVGGMTFAVEQDTICIKDVGKSLLFCFF